MIRHSKQSDTDTILALNLAFEAYLSPLDAERLQKLQDWGAQTWIVERESRAQAFLIGFTDGSGYDSPNYGWFAQRLHRFFYIDRIVVNREDHSLGIGQQLYAHAQHWACDQDLHWLAAEVDIEPANETSLKFHQRQGFVRVADQVVNGKTVGLTIKHIR